MRLHKRVLSYLKNLKKHSQLFTTLTILLVVFSIPLTVIVLEDEQDIRQEAAKNSRTKRQRIPAYRTPTERYAPGKIVVKFKRNTRTGTQAISAVEDRIRERFQAQVTRHEDLGLSEMSVAAGREDATIAQLQRDPSIERVYRTALVYAVGEPNDPDFNEQWGLKKIAAPAAWDVTEGKEDVVIAVVDSGVDEDHPDLKGKIVSGSKVFHDSSNSPIDRNGHGTHVAGIIAANTNDGKGIAGVCPKCKILNVKSLDAPAGQQAKGNGINTAKAIKYAADKDVDIISMSFAFSVDDPDVNEAIQYAADKGIMLIAAAGNTGATGKIYPAAYDDAVLAVGNTAENDSKSPTSTYGSWVDVAAPGTNILSTYVGGDYKEMTGTSMAAPHVSGIAGLLASQGLDTQQIWSKLESTTDNTPGTGEYWRKGRVNAARAVGGTVPKPDKPGDNSPDDKNPKPDPDRDRDPEPCKPTRPDNDKDNDRNPPDRPKRDNDKNGKNIQRGIRDRVSNIRNRVLQRVRQITNQIRNRVGIQSTGSADPCDPDNGSNPRRDRGDGDDRSIIIPKPEKVVVTIRHEEETPGKIRIGDKEYTIDEYNEQFGNDDNTRDNDNDKKQSDNDRDSNCKPGADITIGPVRGNVTIIPGKNCEETNITSVDILEYNLIIDCYSDAIPPRNCDNEKKAKADLNGDGKVNSLDYNQFLRQIAAQN